MLCGLALMFLQKYIGYKSNKRGREQIFSTHPILKQKHKCCLPPCLLLHYPYISYPPCLLFPSTYLPHHRKPSRHFTVSVVMVRCVYGPQSLCLGHGLPDFSLGFPTGQVVALKLSIDLRKMYVWLPRIISVCLPGFTVIVKLYYHVSLRALQYSILRGC